MSSANPSEDAPSARPASLRERRRDYTLNEIASVAIELFDERGFAEVTVEEIAEAAGISARTFFRYFATKDDLVMHEHDRVHRRLVRVLAERLENESAVHALRNAYIETSVVTDEYRRRALTYGRVQLENPALNAKMIGRQALDNQEIVDLLAHRMGVDVETDPRPETIALAMGAVATAMFRRWIRQGGAGSPSDTIAPALDRLVDGLRRIDQDATPAPGGRRSARRNRRR